MSCVVWGCESHSSRKENSQELLTYNRFPVENDQKKEWINRIGSRKWIPKKHSHICSKHFTLDSFVCATNLKWRRLRENATLTFDEMVYVMFLQNDTSVIQNNLDFFDVLMEDLAVTLSLFPLLEHLTEEHCYIKRRQHEDHTYCSSSTSNIFVSDTTGEAESSMRLTPGNQTPSDGPRGTQSMDEPANDGNMCNGIELSSNDDFEEPAAAVFSWQKNEILYPTEDTDVLMCPRVGKDVALGQELGDLSLYDEDPSAAVQGDSVPDKHSEYQCNACRNEIVGFRYTCVQCADWDLCGACEARAEHATHYVLRVPGPRPYNEIQTVLTAIRQQLLSENLFLSEQITEDRVKSEPEDEAPAAGRDPLQPLLSGSEDAQTDGSEYSPPRRKRRRRRHRSSDADDSSDSDTVPDDFSIYSISCSMSNTPEDLLNLKQPHRLTSSTGNTINTRRKPATRSESIHPILEIDTDSLEQPNTNSQEERPEDNISEIPGTICEVPGDAFGVPGRLFQVQSDIFEYPGVFQISGDILQVPDDITVYIEEMFSLNALNIDPLNSIVEEVVDSNSEASNQIMHLRVPPDTNDNALAQALQSQAYVTIQPLATEELRAAKR